MTLENDDIFLSCFGKLTIVRKLGKGKSGISYLANGKDRNVVLKIMHDESNEYYNMPGDRIGAEISAHFRLRSLGMPIPELFCYNAKNQHLVKEFIDGETAADWIANGGDVEKAIPQLFRMAERLAFFNINIDFFPTNFVWTGEKLYYIDYEINDYSEQWNLTNWGLYYWANGIGFGRFLKTGDARFINSDTSLGIPIKDSFTEKIKEWQSRYANRL
ncbi:hypothetical protein JW935_29240 [candidate division KSB1 bacterium]|nr:hypothetical protein [candidate division KSB1 bacterium]